MFFIGGVKLRMNGVFGEYLWRVYDEVRNRPLYVVMLQRIFTTSRTKKAMKKDYRIISVVICASLLHYLVLWLGIRSPLANSRSYLHMTGTGVDHFLQWDSQWYAAIGTYGYKIPLFAQKAFVPAGNHIPFTPALRATVYFPVVPLIVHVFGVIGAVIVTNIIFVATLAIMYTVFRKGMGDGLAAWGLLCYAVNPALIFNSSLYTESYLILFSLLVILGISKGTRAGKLLACTAGFLSALTHETGLFVGIFGLRYLRTREYFSALWFIGSVVAGWVSYFGYLSIQFGQPLIIFSSEKSWTRTWRFPGVPYLIELAQTTNYLRDLELLGVAILMVSATLYISSTIKRDFSIAPIEEMGIHSLEAGLWVLANIILCMSTYVPGHPLMSVIRLVSVIWPIYSFSWVRMRNRRIYWGLPYLVLFGIIGFIGAMLFAHGYFYQ